MDDEEVDNDQLADLVVVLEMQYDDRSPFKGMIDLSPAIKTLRQLDIHQHRQVYGQLTDSAKENIWMETEGHMSLKDFIRKHRE